MAIHATRLKPGQDLKIALQEFASHKNIRAGWVMSCAGSLTSYCLRFANQQSGNAGKGFFEIISLSGTISIDGCHLHIAIADGNGVLKGGHLLEGCIVYTTAEIIVGESHDLVFTRGYDDKTGWNELQIKKIE
ncbi:MAG: DNA-binding protein [Chitinophagaceae bacterium]|nr:DNA-binding protein [Chitinophagaceae bacterium]